MRNNYHPPIEEYLQVIESLSDEGVNVIQARIAERLEKSPPAVSEMIDRLVEEGYVTRHGRELSLTAEGHDIARSVIRKHRLAERLLADVIKLPWHLIHEEAGRWEHVMSDAVEVHIVELLGDPGTCPHGNPIPGSVNEKTDLSAQRPLAERVAGDHFRFERLTEEAESNFDALTRFNEVGFLPNADASVLSKDVDGSMILDVSGQKLSIDRRLSEQLFVVVS
jgi:DtxR family Mn-dependent transcriptional regulator